LGFVGMIKKSRESKRFTKRSRGGSGVGSYGRAYVPTKQDELYRKKFSMLNKKSAVAAGVTFKDELGLVAFKQLKWVDVKNISFPTFNTGSFYLLNGVPQSLFPTTVQTPNERIGRYIYLQDLQYSVYIRNTASVTTTPTLLGRMMVLWDHQPGSGGPLPSAVDVLKNRSYSGGTDTDYYYQSRNPGSFKRFRVLMDTRFEVASHSTDSVTVPTRFNYGAHDFASSTYFRQDTLDLRGYNTAFDGAAYNNFMTGALLFFIIADNPQANGFGNFEYRFHARTSFFN